MVQEVTYNGHTYKIGEFVYCDYYDCEYHCGYFGILRKIELRDSGINNEKFDNLFHVEVMYNDEGYKFEETFETTGNNCYISPAKEMLEQLIKRKQDEIQALSKIVLTEIHKVVE